MLCNKAKAQKESGTHVSTHTHGKQMETTAATAALSTASPLCDMKERRSGSRSWMFVLYQGQAQVNNLEVNRSHR